MTRPQTTLDDRKVSELLAQLDRLGGELGAIDPICQRLIDMCRLALLEHEQKRLTAADAPHAA